MNFPLKIYNKGINLIDDETLINYLSYLDRGKFKCSVNGGAQAELIYIAEKQYNLRCKSYYQDILHKMTSNGQSCCVCLTDFQSLNNLKKDDDNEWYITCQICELCTNLLNTVHTFRETCIKSNIIRKQQMESLKYRVKEEIFHVKPEYEDSSDNIIEDEKYGYDVKSHQLEAINVLKEEAFDVKAEFHQGGSEIEPDNDAKEDEIKPNMIKDEKFDYDSGVYTQQPEAINEFKGEETFDVKVELQDVSENEPDNKAKVKIEPNNIIKDEKYDYDCDVNTHHLEVINELKEEAFDVKDEFCQDGSENELDDDAKEDEEEYVSNDPTDTNCSVDDKKLNLKPGIIKVLPSPPKKKRNVVSFPCVEEQDVERKNAQVVNPKKVLYVKLNDDEKQQLDKIRHLYKCESCPRDFNTVKSLRRHILIKHGDPQQWLHCCQKCNKRFPRKSYYDRHMLYHTGKRNFSCHLCDKKFWENNALQRHVLSHSNIKRFKCSECEKDYKDKRDLLNHMAKIHGVIGKEEIKLPSRERKYSCNICSKAYVKKDRLTRHLLLHSGKKPFNCTICDKKFTDKSYVNQHMRRTHNVDTDTD